MKNRIIINSVAHQRAQGPFGPGHMSSLIVGNRPFSDNNPFLVLVDEKLDMNVKDSFLGQHPHAGIEIYTLILEGSFGDVPEGTMELMNSGSGVIHTEDVFGKIDTRVLQLWVSLPLDKRSSEPLLQNIDVANVPTLANDSGIFKVYAGRAFGLASPVKAHTPVTIVDAAMNENAIIVQEIPAQYNAFILVLEGSVFIGDKELKSDFSGWLDRADIPGESKITYHTKARRSRFIVFAGEPQDPEIVSRGPFVAADHEKIAQLYALYRRGKMKHIRTFPAVNYTFREIKTMN